MASCSTTAPFPWVSCTSSLVAGARLRPVLLVVVAATFGAPPLLAAPAERAGEPPAVDVPLVFEPNLGQTDEAVQFLSRARGYTAFFTGEGLALVLDPLSSAHPDRTVLEIVPRGAHPGARWTGRRPTPGRSHYIVGADPSAWVANVPGYSELVWREARPGLDLRFYERGGHLEYDVIARPGADPSSLEIEFRGADRVRIEPEGDLSVEVDGRVLIQRSPRVFQEIGGERVPVEAEHVLVDPTAVSFRLGSYDRERALVIDPVISYSTFLGGEPRRVGERGSGRLAGECHHRRLDDLGELSHHPGSAAGPPPSGMRDRASRAAGLRRAGP